MPATDRATITGLVLAGGLGRRMGGVDKGLQPFGDAPLVEHVLRRLTPQVDAILINANRNLDAYRGFDATVVADSIEGFAGPLAGLHAGLAACATPLLVSVPCDAPFLPGDLVIHLHEGLERDAADVAVARSGGRLHPVFALMRREVLDALVTYLASGRRKAEDWLATVKTVVVDFNDEAAFANFNTLDAIDAETRER
jgi:molybdopterin-guanine dinucleotide biosynthesis protein A